jgi:hypothetical protein
VRGFLCAREWPTETVRGSQRPDCVGPGEVARLRADNDLQKGAGDLAALRPNGYFRSFPYHRTDERRLRAEVPGAISPHRQ